MSSQQKIHKYLQKSRDAEARATATADDAVKADWARVALGYRDLARLIRNAAVMDKLANRPLP